MPGAIAKPAAMVAAAAPVVIVIARSRPRTGKPPFLVARAVVASVVIIVIARPRCASVIIVIADKPAPVVTVHRRCGVSCHRVLLRKEACPDIRSDAKGTRLRRVETSRLCFLGQFPFSISHLLR